MEFFAALAHADKKLSAFIRQDKARVDEEIRVMQNQQAAVGFKSGATLRKATRIAEEATDRRIAEVVATLKQCIGVIKPSVNDIALFEPTFDKFLPESLDDLGQHIRRLDSIIGAPNTLAPSLDPVIARRVNGLQAARVDLQFLMSGSYKAPKLVVTPLNVLAVVSGIISIVLCVFWVRDPSGPYEPWLALTGIITTGIFGLVSWRRRA